MLNNVFKTVTLKGSKTLASMQISMKFLLQVASDIREILRKF